MSKRIVSVVFENGAMSLGGTIKFGHFFEYAVVNITPGTSEIIGPVIEVEAANAENKRGYFLIPMERVEGVEYCNEEDVESTLGNFQRFLEVIKRRENPMASAMPLMNAPENIQEFIKGVAGEAGLKIVELDDDQPSDEDDDE